MKIGEFAKACGTVISVLRHYDKLGLLKPVYIDRFTEYRYYDKSQIAVFAKISELKAVGFSLGEIKLMLSSQQKAEELFAARRQALEAQLCDLERLRKSGGIKMGTTYRPLIENTDIPFENDSRVIGKWQEVSSDTSLGDKNRIIYFLPHGEAYWCFGWTKGKLIYDDGVSRFLNDYTLEERGDDLYMLIDFKSQDYNETGETTAVALRRLDNVSYTRQQISRKDDIDKPFIPDDRVLGRWKTYCFLEREKTSAEDFVPGVCPPADSDAFGVEYFREITFGEGGSVSAVLGDEVITGADKHTWTRGHWLRKYNSCDCAYEIKEFDGKDYLIIEWKSGDYRFGGYATDYYVMVRE